LNRCRAIELESPEHTLFRFRSGLRDDYRLELITRGITTLEQAYQLVTDLDDLEDPIFTELTLGITQKLPLLVSQTLTDLFLPPSKPASSSSSIKSAGPPGAKPINSERRTISEPGRVNPRTQCYKCQEYGHLASQCPSQTKTLFVEVPTEDIEEEEDDGEAVVHQQDDDSDASVEEYEFNGCIRTVKVMGLPPSVGRTQLGVVKCTLAQPEPLNDWRKTVIFQTCIKIENKSCKVIVNSDSYINAIVSKLITTLRMRPVKHSNPYKVA